MSDALFSKWFSLDGERVPLDGEWVDVDGFGPCVFDRELDGWRRPGDLAHGGHRYRVLDRAPARFLPVVERSHRGYLRRVEGWDYRISVTAPPTRDVRGLPVLDLIAVTEPIAPVRRIVTVEIPANGRPTRYAVVSRTGEAAEETVARAVALRAPYARGQGNVQVYSARFRVPKAFPGHLGRWGVSTFALAATVRPKSRTAWRSRSLRGKLGPKARFLILKRDGYRCQICGATANDGVRLHVDHRVPRSKDGTNDPDNLWVLCEPCNLGKGSLDL